MIFGVGTDIVVVARLGDMYERHGARGLEKLLAPEERAACVASADPARFLAKRFAAKEALGKALGTGVRAPLLLPAVAVAHTDLGQPYFVFDDAVRAYMDERGLKAHLSLSDECDYALAFVVVEKT